MFLSPLCANAQVGINNSAPESTLDILSKGDTAATKAVKVNNSSNTEVLTLTDAGNLGVSVAAPQKKIDADANNDAVRLRNLLATNTTNTDGTIRYLYYNTTTGDVTNRIHKQVQSFTLTDGSSTTLTDATGGLNGMLNIRAAINSANPGANVMATFNYGRKALGLLAVAVDSGTLATTTRTASGNTITYDINSTSVPIRFTISKPTANTITVTNLSGATRSYIITTEPMF